MAGLFTVVVLIVAGHEPDAMTQALARAVDDAIGPNVRVDVRETPVPANTDEAALLERGAHASALAEIESEAGDNHRVRLRVHLAANGRWFERHVLFGAADADAERGRALGYALAAMVPPPAVPPPTVPPPTASPSTVPPPTVPPSAPPLPAGFPPGPPPPAVPPSAGPPPGPPPPTVPPSAGPPPGSPPPTVPPSAGPPSAGSPPGSPTPTVPARASEAPPESRRRPEVPTSVPATRSMPPSAETSESVPELTPGSTPTLAFDFLGLVALDPDGAATVAGGGVTGQWFPHRHFSLRLGFIIRGGTVEVANAAILDFAGGAGLAWHPWRAVRGRPFGLAVRADYLVEYLSMTRYPTGAPGVVEETQSRAVSAVDAFVEGSVRLASGLELVIGLGIEDDFSPTYITVRAAQVATIPELRAMAETGLRIGF